MNNSVGTPFAHLRDSSFFRPARPLCSRMKHTLTVFELLDPEHMTQKSKRLLLTSGNNIRNTEFRGNKSQQGSALFLNNSQPVCYTILC